MTLRELLKLLDKEFVQVIICFEDDEYGDEDNMLIYDWYEEEYYIKYLDHTITEMQTRIGWDEEKNEEVGKLRVFIDIPKGMEE